MAAIIAGGSTYMISRRLKPPPAGPGLISIVAAAKDLTPGVPLSAQDLTTIDWPDNVPLAGSINKIEGAVGRPLIVSVAAREPLLERDLAALGSGFGLSAKIPAGMRATAVRSNEIVGVAGFLFPGSHVDVVVTYSLPPNAGAVLGASLASAAGQTSTQTVLQDVEVLSTGTSIEPDPHGQPQTVSVVTLLLTPEDSQKLLLASAQGTIQFVLRSGVDRENVKLPATRLQQLLANSAEPPKAVAPPVPPRRIVPKAKAEPPAPAPPPVVAVPEAPPRHIIEVIQGTQRSTQTF